MAKIPIDIKTGELEQKDTVIIGIDLGTTNSLVAYMKDGKATPVKGRDGKYTLVPSVLSFLEDGQIIVGEDAKQRLVTNPEQTIYSVKRLLGKSYTDIKQNTTGFGYQIIENDEDQLVKIKVRDRFYSPTELSAEILKYLKARIERSLGQEVSKAIITVPAYFNDNQRQATKDAGKLAGLDVLRIINEPTAASLAYGLNQMTSGTVVVYDLGGGTFDVSILDISDGVFEVLSTNGNTALGGDDFDQLILTYWLNKYELRSIYERDKNFGQALRLLAEKAKKYVSDHGSFTHEIADRSLEITKVQFEELIKPLVDETLVFVERALKDANKSKAEIDKIVLVGGSTRIPHIRETLKNYFNQEVQTNLNPDEIVALGAAVQADILAGHNKDVLLLDITPLSMGIETIGGLMDTIIPRNTTIPTKAGRSYTTSVDGQKNLKIAIYQGERDLVQHNRKLGEFVLKDIPPMPAGIPKIAVHFIIDADGILKVKAMEERSNTETSIQITNQFSISEEEMGQMLLESIHHAKEDMQERSLLESINEANNIIQSTEKFMVQNDIHLSAEQKEKLMGFLAAITSAIDSKNRDQIESELNLLNEYSRPLAEQALDLAIADAIKGKKL